jgi:hypothetical protein
VSERPYGLRKKVDTDDQVPSLLESEVSPKEFRKNWARLKQKFTALIHYFIMP